MKKKINVWDLCSFAVSSLSIDVNRYVKVWCIRSFELMNSIYFANLIWPDDDVSYIIN